MQRERKQERERERARERYLREKERKLIDLRNKSAEGSTEVRSTMPSREPISDGKVLEEMEERARERERGPTELRSTMLSREPISDGKDVMVKPKHQKQKEGSRVEFECIYHGKKKVSYCWLKDGMALHSHKMSTIVLACVELRDFGCYKCRVSVADGDHTVSSYGELDVVPRDGMEYKLLRELDVKTKDKIGELLLTSETWRNVALKFSMSNANIEELQASSSEPGRAVLMFLQASMPDLLAYDFCKTLKEHNIQRFDIIKELLEHLSVPVSESSQRL